MPRGWLLLFCVLLLVGEPAALALAASGRTVQLLADPMGVAVIVMRVLVTALGIAAGLALWTARPAGAPLAKAYLVASSVIVGMMVTTPYVPSNLPPSVAVRLAFLIVAQNIGWFIYLKRSRQVRDLTLHR